MSASSFIAGMAIAASLSIVSSPLAGPPDAVSDPPQTPGAVAFLFDHAAEPAAQEKLRAALASSYAPARKKGKPAAVYATIVVDFKMRN
jgi:hypothetical protein